MSLDWSHDRTTTFRWAPDTSGGFSIGGAGRQDSIAAVLSEAAAEQGDANAYCEYLAVPPESAEAIRAAGGAHVSGFTHSIDASAVRHNLNRHGPRGTADQSVTVADFARLPDIVSGPDEVRTESPSRATRGLATVVYRKRFGEDWIVVEEVRTRRRRLALVSMYKQRATAP